MKEILANIGILFGMLLCAAGLITVLFTQFDPMFSALGLLISASGGWLAWHCKKILPGETSQQSPERSQAPSRHPEKKSTRKNRRHSGRL